MIGIVATLKVQEGKGPDFEAVFKELAGQVRAKEPGNIFYQLTKSRKRFRAEHNFSEGAGTPPYAQRYS